MCSSLISNKIILSILKMGRSYPVAFGFGAIVPVEDFSIVFKGSFEYYEDDTLKPVPNGIQRHETDFVKFVYSEDDDPEYIFITTRNHVNVDASEEEALPVDINLVAQGAEVFGQWLITAFPNIRPGFQLFSYNVR